MVREGDSARDLAASLGKGEHPRLPVSLTNLCYAGIYQMSASGHDHEVIGDASPSEEDLGNLALRVIERIDTNGWRTVRFARSFIARSIALERLVLPSNCHDAIQF
jgi:hypothetical protein